MMAKRGRGRPPKNAKLATPVATTEKAGGKRKSHPTSLEPEPKSTKSSRQSTPVGLRGRPRKTRTYKDAGSDEEKLSDDEFEAKLANEMESEEEEDDQASMTPEERKRAETLELASKSRSRLSSRSVLTSHRKANRPQKAGQPSGSATSCVQLAAQLL
jgi:ATP-dependent DNA helicase